MERLSGFSANAGAMLINCGRWGCSMPIFALRTTSNREDQVFDFISANAGKRKIPVFSIIRPHGLRGYIFIEAESRQSAEEAYHKVSPDNSTVSTSTS